MKEALNQFIYSDISRLFDIYGFSDYLYDLYTDPFSKKIFIKDDLESLKNIRNNIKKVIDDFFVFTDDDLKYEPINKYHKIANSYNEILKNLFNCIKIEGSLIISIHLMFINEISKICQNIVKIGLIHDFNIDYFE